MTRPRSSYVGYEEFAKTLPVTPPNNATITNNIVQGALRPGQAS